MTMTPSTPLKIGAVAFGVLWTLWMLWWSGSLDRVYIAMLTICGAMAGYLWYLCMRWGARALTLPAKAPTPLRPRAEKSIRGSSGAR